MIENQSFFLFSEPLFGNHTSFLADFLVKIYKGQNDSPHRKQTPFFLICFEVKLSQKLIYCTGTHDP